MTEPAPQDSSASAPESGKAGAEPSPSAGDLEPRIAAIGTELRDTLLEVLEQLPASGPQPLATRLGLNKVLTSRLLKAVRTRDPMAMVFHCPGPAPLQRFLKAARRVGVSLPVLQPAEAAVEAFARLVRDEIGDRSALNALISAWLPDARSEFELRQKQAAFRALSQLRGAAAAMNIATVLLHPSADGKHLDVVWIFGLLSLQRLRPGVPVKFSTRRLLSATDKPRHPTTLDGTTLTDLDDVGTLRLDEFCDSPPALVDVHRSGESVHYVLGGDAYGPSSAVDLLMAEANLGEMPRYIPEGSGRKGYVFAEVGTPARSLLFDVLIHPDVYPGSTPSLLLYDTALDGVADVNDPSRDIDRMELTESIQHLGRGSSMYRLAGVPHYVAMLRHVTERMGWDADEFAGYRCCIDYPVYGSQVVMAFDPPNDPD